MASEAAWDSALRAELEGVEPDQGAIAILLDLSKCYERIPLLDLARRARAAGWPGRVVALAVGQYAAVRWVSVADATIPAGAATHGMVAGCAWAVKFLADFMRPRLQAAMELPWPDGMSTTRPGPKACRAGSSWTSWG